MSKDLGLFISKSLGLLARDDDFELVNCILSGLRHVQELAVIHEHITLFSCPLMKRCGDSGSILVLLFWGNSSPFFSLHEHFFSSISANLLLDDFKQSQSFVLELIINVPLLSFPLALVVDSIFRFRRFCRPGIDCYNNFSLVAACLTAGEHMSLSEKGIKYK